MYSYRRDEPMSRRENDNKFRERDSQHKDYENRNLNRSSFSDNRMRDDLRNRGRDYNFGGSDNRIRPSVNDFVNERHNQNFGRSDDRQRERFNDFSNTEHEKNFHSNIRENSDNDGNQDRERNFRNDYQVKDSLNDFSDKGREKNFGSGFHMRENSNDNSDRDLDRKFESDYQLRDSINDFSDQGREKKFESNFRMRENSDDDSNQGRERNFQSVYQMSFNDFSDQGREKNFGSGFRMRESDQDLDRNFGSDYQFRDSINDFSDQGHEKNFESSIRIPDNSNDFIDRSVERNFRSDYQLKDSKHGNDYQMRESCNDFYDPKDFNDFGSNDRLEESYNNFHNQGRNTNFESNDRMRESFNEFGSGDRDSNFRRDRNSGGHSPIKDIDLFQRRGCINPLRQNLNEASTTESERGQNTFYQEQDSYLNRDSSRTRDNDNRFGDQSQGTNINNFERYIDIDSSRSSQIPRRQDSVNYSKAPKRPMNSYFNDRNQRNDNILKRNNQRKEQNFTKTQNQFSPKKSPNSFRNNSDFIGGNRKRQLEDDSKDIVSSAVSDLPVTKPLSKKVRKKWNRKARQQQNQLNPDGYDYGQNQDIDDNDQQESDVDNMSTTSSKSNCSNASLRLVIKNTGNKIILKRRKQKIMKSIEDRIAKDKTGGPRPSFTFAVVTDGVLRLTCANKYSSQWAYDNIPHLEDLWKNAQLEVNRDMESGRKLTRIPKESTAFEPINALDLKVQLVDRNQRRGEIININKFKLQQNIMNMLSNSLQSPFKFDKTKQDMFLVACKDLASMQWLYDNLSRLNYLWPNADLRLVQRRTVLYYRKMKFTLKRQNMRSASQLISRIHKDNRTLNTGLWKPYQMHSDGYTVALLIDEESVREIEALGSRMQYFGQWIDVTISPRNNSLPKQSFIKDSLLGSECNDTSGTYQHFKRQ